MKQIWLLEQRLFALSDVSLPTRLFLCCYIVVVILAGKAALIHRITSRWKREPEQGKTNTRDAIAKAQVLNEQVSRDQVSLGGVPDETTALEHQTHDEKLCADQTFKAQVHSDKVSEQPNPAPDNNASEEKTSQDFASVEQLPDGHAYDQTLESPGYIRRYTKYGLEFCCSSCGDELTCYYCDDFPHDG